MQEYKFLKKLRSENPLVHCITNIVVANFQANGLLALGASPIMADAIEEVAEMSAISSCTVLNIGTLRRDTVTAMLLAGKSANEQGVPVVLDPVGAGATVFRKETVSKILKEINISLIRCNAGELAAIAGIEWSARGVDAGEGQADISTIAKEMAQKLGCLIAVTGEIDILTDGTRLLEISGGHSLMSKVTGSGCLLSAVAGAFLAISNKNDFEAVAEALSFYKKAGESASENASAPGQFAVHFLDELAN
ncbi:hydroxyethylthiazole kinase [Bacillus niameyensis]|uniref:hydroxyethylthiazole kinase n=1 Tax=Bacillus niameyensis TaxID=1522308 RepID=UPI000783AA83|nr:hydroxyethylthiazole kinase [Bacillus niameyensis]